MRKILIADDDPYVRELLEVTLSIGAYQLSFASSGEEALQRAKADQPDVILLDVMMDKSQIDGLEVCWRLKQDPATASISIIIISGTGQKNGFRASQLAGADGYITKPFSPTALLTVIENLVLNL